MSDEIPLQAIRSTGLPDLIPDEPPASTGGTEGSIATSRPGGSRAPSPARFDAANTPQVAPVAVSPSQSRRATPSVSNSTDTSTETGTNSPARVGSDGVLMSVSVLSAEWGYAVDLDDLSEADTSGDASERTSNAQTEPYMEAHAPSGASDARGSRLKRHGITALWGLSWSLAAVTISMATAPLWTPLLGSALIVNPWVLMAVGGATLLALMAAWLLGRQQANARQTTEPSSNVA